MKFSIDQLFVIRDAIKETGTLLNLSQIETVFDNLNIIDYGTHTALWKKSEHCKKCGFFVKNVCTSNRDCLDGGQFEWPEEGGNK